MNNKKTISSSLLVSSLLLVTSMSYATSFKYLSAKQTPGSAMPTIVVESNGYKWVKARNTTLNFRINVNGKVKCCNRYIHYVGAAPGVFPQNYRALGEPGGVPKYYRQFWNILTRRKKIRAYKKSNIKFDIKTSQNTPLKIAAVAACNRVLKQYTRLGHKASAVVKKARTTASKELVVFGIVAGKSGLGKSIKGDQRLATRGFLVKVLG